MRSRLVGTTLVVVFALSLAAPLSAEDCLSEFLHSVGRDTKRRNCWPEPFVRADRCAVRAPLEQMVFNGWRMQNTLSDHHFQPESGELTEAGRLKVRWIVAEAPRQHRSIYIQRTDNPEATAARVDHVQQLAARLVPQGELPQVQETDVAVSGWPAARVDMIGRKFMGAMPEPKLPKLVSDDSGK